MTPPPRARRARGPTVLSHVLNYVTESNQRNHVDLDDNNRPVGPRASEFVSYLGTIAKNRVDILKNIWKEIDEKDKDIYWMDVLVSLYINIHMYIFTYTSV